MQAGRRSSSSSGNNSNKKPKRKASRDPSREGTQRSAKKPKTELGGRFKYSSFNQQIANIDVGSSNLLQSASTSTLQAPDQDDEEDLLDSEFGRALQRIKLLDTTLEFVELSHALNPLCRSLPLILLHRQTIVQLLLRHLPSASSSYPIELVPALADTGADLVLPDVVPLLDCLIDLAFTSQDAEMVSKALNAVGHLFRALGKDISEKPELRSACWTALAAPLSGLSSVPTPAILEADPQDAEAELNAVSEDEHEEETPVAARDAMDVDQLIENGKEVLPAEDGDDNDSEGKEQDAAADEEQIQIAQRTRLSARQRRTQRGTGSAHLRHLLATAFAYFVRKCAAAHHTALAGLVQDISTSLSTSDQSHRVALSQSVAWIIVESAKSTSIGLHTRFSAMFKVFAQGLSQNHSDVTQKALVGLIHHVGPSKPDDTTGDKDREILCNAVFALAQAHESAHRSLLRTLIGTNKARAIPPSLRATWFSTVARVLADAATPPALAADLATWSLVRANVGDLTAARHNDVSIVDRLFEVPIQLCMNATLLLKDHWKLFDDFVPARMAARLVDHASTASLSDAIQKMAILREHGVWARLPEPRKQEFGALVSRFRASLSPDPLSQPLSALAAFQLHTFAQPTNQELQEMITALLRSSESSSLHAQLLAVCLWISSSLSMSDHVIATEQVGQILQQYGSSAAVLEALLSSHASSPPTTAQLLSNLASQVDSVRSFSARLLQRWTGDEQQRAAGIIVDVEEVPLSFHEARERCLKLRRVAPFVKSCSSDEAREMAVTYLTGCLKINFKPVWSEAITGLVSLAQDHEDLVWQVAGQALLDTAVSNFQDVPVLYPSDPNAKPVESAWDVFFEDRSLQQLEGAMTRSLSLGVSDSEHERVNPQTFESQLLSLFGQARGAAQKHSRQLVPLYLDLFGPSPTLRQTLPSKLRRQRLSGWLDMFAHFNNPKALFQSDQLYQSHLRHLTQGDPAVQKLALSAILTWKQSSVSAFSDRLYALLETSKFRDTLLDFHLAPDADVVPQSSRPELLPIVIRLFYGLLTARHAFPGRRLAVLQALRHCQPTELDLFIDLMLGPFGQTQFALDDAMSRKALGFLSLLSDVLKQLAEVIWQRVPDLGRAVLTLAKAARSQDDHQSREIQRECLKRVVDIVRYAPDVGAGPSFTKEVAQHLIQPRLDASDNSQVPTALLDLAILWSSSEAQAHLLQSLDSRLLPILFKVLQQKGQTGEHAKVCDLVTSLVDHGDEGSRSHQQVLQPHIGVLLHCLATSIANKAATQQSITDDLSKVQLHLLTKLAPFAVDQETSIHLCTAVLGLLRKPHAVVPERFKQEALQILTTVLLRLPLEEVQQDKLQLPLFGLFASLRQRNSRIQLAKALESLASVDLRLQRVASLLTELNAYSVKRSEEPDFDRRLPAFAKLTDELAPHLSAVEWHPVLHNLFFLMHDTEEMSIRGNASLALRRFVAVAAAASHDDMRAITSDVFLPGIRKGLKFREELIRTEFLQVLAVAVSDLPGYSSLSEMQCLLVGGDPEANFFNNIHHIQLHRRTRALRRLADEAEAGHLSSRVLKDTFLPLIHHFFPSHSGDSANPDLINETVQCIARVAKALTWSTWRALAHQYLRLIRPDTPSLKSVMRVVVGVLKAFHFDLSDPVQAPALNHVNATLLPQVLKIVDDREVAEEVGRISLAEGVATVVAHLPAQRRDVEASGLFLSVSRILRSKEQAVRDAARTTICSIVLELGSDSLPIAVKELRTALQRGPQQHVLAFTSHALLVRLFEVNKTADVTAAVPDLVAIIDHDLFGAPAKDRDNKDFRSRSTYREIKTSKSSDSLQILATMVQLDHLSMLLAPLRSVMASTESLKTLRVVDDSLTHIAQGLQANPHLNTQQLLSLCNSLITENSTFTKSAASVAAGKKGAKNKVRKDYAVNPERRSVDTASETYASNVHRFICLGLDLLNTAFRRNRFDLHDADIISRLDPLISATGNSLFSSNDLVLSRALKAAASLLRCPLGSVEKAAPIMVKQTLKILQSIGGTESEVAQSAIRALTVIIRECKTAKLGEKQLTDLLKLISPDLEEPDRQAILFGLLRAIMSRKFVCPEIYDLMDRIAEFMVTNQSASVRELCRAIFLQFLLDYPQGKSRLRSSLEFLARNISYTHESGRLSTLEIIHAVFSKFSADLLQDTAELFFISLVLCVTNDESPKCREASGALIKLLIQRVSPERQSSFFGLLVTWAEQTDKPLLLRAALQLLGVYCEALDTEGGQRASSKALPLLASFITKAAQQMQKAQSAAEEESDKDVNHQSLEWSAPYQAMQSSLKIFVRHPSLIDEAAQGEMWAAVQHLLLHPHAWIRMSSARLLGAFYASNPAAASIAHRKSSDMLSISRLVDSADKMSIQLQSRLLSSALAMQIVKNLFFVGKALAGADSDEEDEETPVEEHEEDEETAAQTGATTSIASAVDLVDKQKKPLKWLFARLARQARLAHVKRPSPYAAEKINWSLQPISILQWFAAMINHLTEVQLQPLLFILVTPLFRILEDSSRTDDQMEELQKLGHEVQELLQQKVGEQTYLRVHAAVSKSVSQHRQARREKASLQVINDPAVAAQTKLKGSERKKEARKRKSSAYKAAREANL